MKKIHTKWRKLPIKVKLNIPKKQFGIDDKILIKIRNIKDSRKRLIKSAKIQYELFGEIHSCLTAWIAGYSSDSVIRQKFGSTKELREIFIKSPKINKKIKPSFNDIKRNIKIPNKMNGDLAEETGIHIGDGNLYIYTDKKGYKSSSYTISGDLIDEEIYHKEHITKLMERLYNIKGFFAERPSKGNIDSKYKSKALVEFKSKILKLPIGSKKEIKIPEQILKNKYFMKRCIAGIIDTDFSITSSLAISGKINNLFVAKEIHNFFKKENINHVCKDHKNYIRFYIPKKEAIKIIKKWKLNNIKHLSKYEIHKKFGVFIPYTTTSERFDLLEEKINLKQLKKISKERKLNKR